MKLLVQAPEHYYGQVVADLIRLFFPEAKMVLALTDTVTSKFIPNRRPGEVEAVLTFRELNAIPTDRNLATAEFRNGGMLPCLEASFQVEDKEAVLRAPIPSGPAEERVNLHRRLIRQMTLRVLEEITGRPAGPWGILTGPRPTKLVQRRLDQGWEPEAVLRELIQEYKLAPAKACLLLEVVQRQRPLLLSSSDARRWVSIYLGIPFCPTRCLYCSFPGYAIPRTGTRVESFLAALIGEIKAVGEAIQQQDLRVQTVYIGGGTPTALTSDQLNRLLTTLREHLPFIPASGKSGEFTVEAGRPDTLDLERLEVLKAAGVNRLSINPQTMQDRTLDLIGRKHSAADTLKSFYRAREVGFTDINMDVILGLPGETRIDVAATLDSLAQLKPENLSVHILAVKRASRLKEERQQWSLPAPEEVERMLQISREVTAAMGMLPYYLYRQKNILGNLENVGYSQPGRECLYNIQVMEERQTIIGLGGGAGSKWVNPQDWTLVNTYNPKDPQNYVDRIAEVIEKKINRIRGLRVGEA